MPTGNGRCSMTESVRRRTDTTARKTQSWNDWGVNRRKTEKGSSGIHMGVFLASSISVKWR